MPASEHLVTRILVPAAALACALLVETGAARAASGDRIGDAIVIVNTVTADYKKKNRTLSAGDDVRQDEVIEVKPDAQGELKLDDDTKLALGPGSRLVLDKFVYDSDRRAGSIVLDLTKGAFRFITGVAAKPAYVIKTPNASITVRGTVFDTFVLPDLSAWVLLHSGAIEVTGRKSACRVLDQPGRLMRISSDGSVSKPVDWAKLTGNKAVDFDKAFPFIAKPPQIDPQPVLTRAAVVEGARADEPDKACVNAKPPVHIRKASTRSDDDGDKPRKKSRTTKTETAAPRVKVSTDQRPRRPRGSDDGYGNAASGISIVIGIGGGLGGFGKNRGHSGPKYPNRGPN